MVAKPTGRGNDAMASDGMVDALTALRSLVGRRVQVTLAFGEILLARTDLVLEDVLVEELRLVLTGSFDEEADRILYREVSLPLAEDGDIGVAAFAGELRLETSEGFFLEVIPLGDSDLEHAVKPR